MTIQKISNKSDLTHLYKNDFIHDLKLIYTEMQDKKTYIKTYDNILIPAVYKVEYQLKTNLFISKKNTEIILSLNHPALQLFLFIAHNLKANQDIITINRKRFIKQTNSSKSSYLRATKELTQKQIIKTTDTGIQDEFYINPAFLFNGSRLKKYPDKAKPYKNSQK